ncbi:hypothetical protein, partial [Pseudomonas aeruginosa]|uniref:hypothetical protein n=1 Tax=Pseudomonas aeruginosa TaxID=287 RepID=UPI001C5018E3
VEVDFFDFAVGAHHAGLAPEGNREHSIGHQVSALNVGFMEHLLSFLVAWLFFCYCCFLSTLYFCLSSGEEKQLVQS